MKIKQNPFANCTTLQHLDTDGWELKPSKMYNYAKGDVDMGNSMDDKRLLFSLSKAKGDFIVQPFKGSGKGGQKRNKTMSACRIIHPASGTVSECQEERNFDQNKKKAFERLVEKETFKKWYKVETAKALGLMTNIEEKVDKAMTAENIKVEYVVDGKWTEMEALEKAIHSMVASIKGE